MNIQYRRINVALNVNYEHKTFASVSNLVENTGVEILKTPLYFKFIIFNLI
jgi:hypothetical protein